MRVVGVDGCRGGWIAACWDTQAGDVALSFHAGFEALLESFPDAACIGIDIPIGLSDAGPRACDLAARRLLGPRRSSVFPAPHRWLFGVVPYLAAGDLLHERTGKRLSVQAYNIIHKVAEVDAVMRRAPLLQARVIEVHPEVSFWAMNHGQPLRHGKKRVDGFAERRDRLLRVFDIHCLPDSRRAARRRAPFAAPDDLLDAIAVAWSARRHAEGRAGRVPDDPPLDAFGLRMEIVY